MNAAGGFQAANPRHADVHEHNVGPQLAALGHGAFAIVYLTHDLNIALIIEQVGNTCSHQVVIIGD